MPDKPSYFDKIPSALEQLTSIADEYIDRECVESLLDVKRRRAQNIMTLVGTKSLNGRAVMLRQDFILFLEAQGGAEYRKTEMERRKRFAIRLEQIRQEREEKPEYYVEAPPKARVKEIARRGLDSLPPGMVERGRIVIGCDSFEAAVSWLKEIAIALAVDQERFRERFEGPKEQGFQLKGSAPPAQWQNLVAMCLVRKPELDGTLGTVQE